jgi:hypothetical protein
MTSHVIKQREFKIHVEPYVVVNLYIVRMKSRADATGPDYEVTVTGAAHVHLDALVPRVQV